MDKLARICAISDLIGEGADHESDNGSGCNRGENRIAAIVIVDPVIAMRRVIKAPIIIVSDDDRVRVVAVISTDIIARHIVAIIHVSERRARVIIERTVSTPVEGAGRVMPEIVPTILVPIVVAIVVAAIIPIEVSVIAIIPIVIVVPVMAIMAIIVVPISVPVIASRIAIALIVAAII